MVNDKKKIQFIRYFNGTDEILILKNYKGVVIRKFIYDEEIKKINNFKVQKRANEKVLLDYYSKKSKNVYVPTPKADMVKQISTFKLKHDESETIRKIKNFKNENRIVFTNKKLYKLQDFKHSYIRVRVRVYLDGFHTETIGRSDFYDGQIPTDLKGLFLLQAIKRAIAPFGSDVKYELLDWDYAYYQKKEMF